MSSLGLKWRRLAFVTAFVISIHHAVAGPLVSDNPCHVCGKDPKDKLPTFKGFVNVETDVKVDIISACSTIDFLCSTLKSQEGLKKSKKMEQKDICEIFSTSNGLAVDCEKEDKNEECAKAKTFMEKMGELEYCKSVCHADETKSVCEGLFQVQETVSSSAGGAKKSETEEVGVENKPLSARNSEVKKPAIASVSNSSTNVEGGKENVKSDGKMKQIKKSDNGKEAVTSPSKDDEKVKNNEPTSSEANEGLTQAEKGSTTAQKQGTSQKEGSVKGNKEDEEGAPKADLTDNKKKEKTKVDGTGQGAPGDVSRQDMSKKEKDITDDKKKKETEIDGFGRREQEEEDHTTTTTTPRQDTSEKETGSVEHVDSGDTQQAKRPQQPEQTKPHIINHMNQSMSDSEKSYGHVMSYFFALTVICIICYLVFHNKQKLIALVLEGRQRPSGRRGARRSSSAQYRKLDNNLEEAGGPNSGTTFSQAVY